MENILVEVITPTLSNLEIGCFGCQMFTGISGLRNEDRQASVQDFPADLRERNERIVKCINEVRNLYPGRIQFRIIDALSPLGLWKLVRYRIFNLPAWIVDRQTGYTGADPDKLGALIGERIKDK